MHPQVCAALADQMYGWLGEQAAGDGCWWAAWEEWSSLAALGAAGRARQLAMLPVVAHSRGRYHTYLWCWCCAQRVWHHTLAPLLGAAAAAARGTAEAACSAPPAVTAAAGADAAHEQRQRLAAVMRADACLPHAQLMQLMLGGCSALVGDAAMDGSVSGSSSAGDSSSSWVGAVLPADASELRRWLWMPGACNSNE